MAGFGVLHASQLIGHAARLLYYGWHKLAVTVITVFFNHRA